MPASIYLRAAGALLLSVAGAAEMQAQCYGCNSTGHSAYIYCDNWSEGGSSYCSWGVDYPGDPSMPEQYWCLQGGTCNASLTDELADGTYHLGSADNPLEEALAGLNDSYNTRPLSLASVALAAANDGGARFARGCGGVIIGRAYSRSYVALLQARTVAFEI